MVGLFFLRLVTHNSLETLTTVAFLGLFVFLTAPWNPWDVSSVSAEGMDNTGIPRWGWVGYVGLTLFCKSVGIITQHIELRSAGAALGFTFWLFLMVAIYRVAPYTILLPCFAALALGCVMIFVNLQVERARARDVTSP